MRVLIVHDYGTLNGGAEYMAVTLREGLRRRGHEARFFASSARPLPIDIVADYTCFGTTGPARRVLQVANPSAVLGLRRALADFRPDVVHLRMFLTQLSPFILPLLRPYPTLMHVASYDLICPLDTKVLPDGSACHYRPGIACYRERCLPLLGLARTVAQHDLWRRWRGAVDLIVANSDWTRRRLQSEGVDVTETVWNGVPVRPARPPLRSPPTVVYAGRLFQKKGVDVLLRAMANVVATLPAARLMLLGDGPERQRLEALAGQLGLQAHVTFFGHRPRAEMEELVADAWVQAVPSLWEEPFGLVAAEAMMRGTAVVASNSGGLSEQVRDGETGFAVPPADVDALTGALRRLLRDRDLAERMGQAGRAVALAELTEDRAVDRFVGLYERLRAESPAGPPSRASR